MRLSLIRTVELSSLMANMKRSDHLGDEKCGGLRIEQRSVMDEEADKSQKEA